MKTNIGFETESQNLTRKERKLLQEIREDEFLFLSTIFGGFIGLVAPPTIIAFEMLPVMEDDLYTLLETYSGKRSVNPLQGIRR